VLAAGSTTSALRGTVPVADGSLYPVTTVDLYVADPLGIATGQAVQPDELPYGFVQGRTYLGSFTVDGPQDKDPAPAAFEFDLAALVSTDVLLTITANYATGAAAAQTVVLTSPFSDPLPLQGQAGEFEFTGISLTPQGVRLEWTAAERCSARRPPRTAGRMSPVPPAPTPCPPPASRGSSASGVDRPGQGWTGFSTPFSRRKKSLSVVRIKVVSLVRTAL